MKFPWRGKYGVKICQACRTPQSCCRVLNWRAGTDLCISPKFHLQKYPWLWPYILLQNTSYACLIKLESSAWLKGNNKRIDATKIWSQWFSIDEILQRLCMISRLLLRRSAIKASYSNVLRMEEQLIKVKLFVIVLFSIACKNRTFSFEGRHKLTETCDERSIENSSTVALKLRVYSL